MGISKAITCDAKTAHSSNGMKTVQKTPWIQPPFENKRDYGHLIHGQKWLSVFIDEAHAVRRRGPQYQAIVQSSVVVICATATPLHTKLSDLVNMAQLLRFPQLCSEDGYDKAIKHERQINRLRTLIPKDEGKQQAQASMSGTPFTDSPQSVEWKEAAQSFITNIRAAFKGRIIRRMVTSKDWRGAMINDLPPYQEEIVFLDLTELEYVQLQKAEEKERKGCV